MTGSSGLRLVEGGLLFLDVNDEERVRRPGEVLDAADLVLEILDLLWRNSPALSGVLGERAGGLLGLEIVEMLDEPHDLGVNS